MEFVLKESSAQLLTVFAIIALGYLLGAVRIKGVGLGTAAIFLSGLLFGHFGAVVPAALQTVGLVLFITSVGMSAGPGFVSRLRKNGRAYVILCLSIALAGSLVCAALIRFAGVEAPLAVGMMTGTFTTSPGFAAAKEAVSASESAVATLAAGYGVAYPVGVVCKVLFIQLVPRLLRADMDAERAKIAIPPAAADSRPNTLKKPDAWGLLPFSAAAALGIILGGVTLPLPGGASFALGSTGGPLVVGLAVGGIGRIGKIDLRPDGKLFGPAKEIGLMLFFSGAGVEGGRGLAAVLSEYGFGLLLFGFALVAIPLAVGFFLFYRVLKLPLLNGLGSMTAGMTCTPSLAVLIQTAGTDDVAAAYAATYPIALVTLVLAVQVLVRL